jgi:hypothetical protein
MAPWSRVKEKKLKIASQEGVKLKIAVGRFLNALPMLLVCFFVASY